MFKKRLIELDVMRAIAFLFIVIQHTIGGFSYRDDISFNDFAISKFIYIMAQNGVEFFIFLTAVSLVYTYYEKFDIKTFYIKKLKFLVIPFVLWSLIIMINNGESINFQSILVIFSGDAQYHLWYMGMILRIYLYFPIILWIIRKVSHKSIYVKGILFIILYYLYYEVLSHYGIADFVSNHLFINPSDLQKRFVNISPLFYYFYFVLGIYAVFNYKKFKEMILKCKYVVIMLYFLCFGFYYYIAVSERCVGLPVIKSSIGTSILYRTISILFFYLISCIIEQKLKIVLNVAKVISRYSYPAYLIHVIIVNSLTFYIPIEPKIMVYVKLFFLVTCISIVVSAIMNYIPYSEYIIGVKSKMKFNLESKTIHLRHIGQ